MNRKKAQKKERLRNVGTGKKLFQESPGLTFKPTPPTRSDVPKITTHPFELTPQKKKMHEEWRRVTKVEEFYAQLTLDNQSDLNDRFMDALNAIHDCMAREEWYRENTPFFFKERHSSIALMAGLACRYLRELALANNHWAIRELAEIATDSTETLTELLTTGSQGTKDDEKLVAEINRIEGVDKRVSETPAELLRTGARGLPYFPMLRFLNTAANAQEHFEQIAEQLELGKECPINVSATANWSLQTPINYFVWKCLKHFQNVHWHIRDGFKGPGYGHVGGPAKTFEKAAEGIILTKVESPPARRSFMAGLIKREDIPIYKVSYELPPLTKSTAMLWANKAIVPYVVSKYPDFSKVPTFAGILRRKDVKTRGQQRKEIRKDIIRALTSLSRP